MHTINRSSESKIERQKKQKQKSFFKSLAFIFDRDIIKTAKKKGGKQKWIISL